MKEWLLLRVPSVHPVLQIPPSFRFILFLLSYYDYSFFPYYSPAILLQSGAPKENREQAVVVIFFYIFCPTWVYFGSAGELKYYFDAEVNKMCFLMLLSFSEAPLLLNGWHMDRFRLHESNYECVHGKRVHWTESENVRIVSSQNIWTSRHKNYARDII